MPNRYIIVTGNPVDGFTFYGTANGSDAVDAASRAVLEADWWVAPLHEFSQIGAQHE